MRGTVPLAICIKKEKEPQSELAKWAKDEFKLEKVPRQQTISDILKNEHMAGQSTILILKSFETCTSRVTTNCTGLAKYRFNEYQFSERVLYYVEFNEILKKIQ
ncbi:hypothetical protein BDA99DRAFT_540383 [Phascolomyces articulosus]|uniref:Uncharacterized protein n=1 Tax=Phascolomyces articulosus TaxID=60185 RepID=A0AAD5PAW0_9FUNG|nr:hypothetical protein BDA99DRAFT_540383 [Phascolomyces articulosus]